MISTRLKNIVALSIPLFISHGLEEIVTGFYHVDSHSLFVFHYLNSLPAPQAVFVLFQIMLWLTLLIAYALILGPQWHIRLLTILGIGFIYELHHLYKAFVVGGYYPGIITAIPLYIVGFFFWRELIKNHRCHIQKTH